MRALKQTVSRPLRTTGIILAAPLLVALTACGSATSTDEVPTTVAPLSALPTATQSAAPASGAASASASAASAAPSATVATPAPQDQTREISEIPTPDAVEQYSAKDKGYLDELAQGGIDVAGVEPQLFGIASDVCQAKENGQQSYLVDAVGGQLVEQGHTQLSAEEAGRLIAAAAEHAYC